MSNPYRQTVRQKIIGTLRRHGGWMSGMQLESYAYDWRSKRIGRTLRDMSSGEDAVLDKKYNTQGAVGYKIKEL